MGQKPDSVRRERRFCAAPEQVAEVRTWAAQLLPEHCDVRDEAILLLSEVMANAAVHSPVESVLVTVEHGGNGFRGAVREEGFLSGSVVPSPTGLAEMRLLATLPEGVEVNLALLGESGRGLALVAMMCGPQWGVSYNERERTVWFVRPGCRCQLRARYPDWGLLPINGGRWRAVRHGFTDLTATTLGELEPLIAQAERLQPTDPPQSADLLQPADPRSRPRPDGQGKGPPLPTPPSGDNL